jgi:peptide-methionine (S)-S-oxide reductase
MKIIAFVQCLFLLTNCNTSTSTPMTTTTNPITQPITNPITTTDTLQTAVFAAGCFWCVEAQLEQLTGVSKVESGYMGGTIKNPSYKDVCTGLTGHAEVVRVTYNPQVVNYTTLLQAFFGAHDPTTLNRQGGDVGTQYRSSIFYSNNEQKNTAETVIGALNKDNTYGKPIVTILEPLAVFYVAEEYHQNYFNLNGEQPYCQFVVKPKMEKFQKVFKDLLKK